MCGRPSSLNSFFMCPKQNVEILQKNLIFQFIGKFQNKFSPTSHTHFLLQSSTIAKIIYVAREIFKYIDKKFNCLSETCFFEKSLDLVVLCIFCILSDF